MTAQSSSGDQNMVQATSPATATPGTGTLTRLLVASNALLAADAKHTISVLEHSTPNTWRQPFARALLVERAHLMALRSKVLELEVTDALAKSDVLDCLEANASALLDIATSVTTGSSKAAANYAQAAAVALATANKAGAAALSRLQ